MESEPARAPGLAANECVPRHGLRLLRSPHWMRNPIGDGTRPENGRALALQVRLLPHPLARSSSGQSTRLIRERQEVQVLPGQLDGSSAGENGEPISRASRGFKSRPSYGPLE